LRNAAERKRAMRRPMFRHRQYAIMQLLAC
jgi:hypothetical protein